MYRTMTRWAVLSIVLLAACNEDPTGTARVARVDVSAADQVLVVGDSATLTALALTAGGDVVVGQMLWRTLSPAVATLEVSGGSAVVKARAPGVARIEAESGGRKGSVDVTVIAAPVVAAVTLLPTTLVLEAGQTAAIQAVAATGEGDVVTGRAVTWAVTGTAVTVNAGTPGWATVTAHTTGEAVIRATIDGIAGEADVQVVTATPPPPQVATVEIAPSGFSLPVNHETPLQAIAKDAAGNMISGLPVTWTSTADAVASITPIGVSAFASLLAKSAGTVTIRATVAGVTGELALQVTAAPPPANEPMYLFFSSTHRGIWVNQLLDFSQFLTGHGRNGPIEDPDVIWSVEDPAIAVVDENGNVRGLTAGTTRIRATAGDVVGATLVTVFQPVPSPVVYDLTGDWWDGQWHMPAQVGEETWTDDNGTEHDVPLWATGGTLTLADDGDYERVLVLQGWVTVDGTARLVVERQVVDRGSASIMVGGETGYWMHSETTPGYVYALVAHQPGNLIMRAEVGTAPELSYMFRMRQ
ncbi:MAG TPA: Ig-like domain-containing protein [Longimicrobiales bacterium]|nr:Ig-like domain-containing protein [Longimicrobiales bacterium]